MNSTRRLTCSLLLGVLAALLPLVPPPAEASSTYLCTSYSGCQEAGYSHYGYRTAGRQMWWRMYSGHNCTNYVAYRLVRGGMSATRPWTGSGDADNWGRVKPRITDDKPMVGSVAWWKRNVPGAGSSGHVAYVERVISPSRIVVSEDSWSGDFHWRTITKAGSGWPSGFIHFDDRKVANRAQPRIGGRPKVGEPLVATTGRWSVRSSKTIRWYADGKRIRGATSARFRPGAALQGSRLSVRVTASRRGYLDGQRSSERTVRVARGDLETISAPSVIGRPRVGEVLSVRAGTWAPRPESTAVRWFAGREPIAGAGGTRLRLAPEHRGKRISVRMTAHRDGYRSSPVRSQPTTRIAAGRIRVISPLTVDGRPKLGARLSLDPGKITPGDASMTYTWLRNGRAVPGATGSSYVPGLADVGKRLSLRVRLRHAGYRDRTVTVPTAGRVTTRPSLSVWTSGLRGGAVVRVKVTAPGVRTPGGEVAVRIGTQRAAGRLNDGRLRVVLRDLGAGLRNVRVRYAGTDVVRPGSLVTTVRVRRP